MNKPILTLALVMVAFLAASRSQAEPVKPSPSPAAVSAPSGPQTYDSFRLVRTRNVFDPDRRPVRPAAAGTPAPAPPRADYAALTGTMLSTDKTYAFFSGSRPEFNRVLTVQEKIARATITAITAQNIEVERDGKRTVVAVGQTVPFDNNTAPGLPPAADTPAPDAPVSGAVSAAASPAAAPPASAYTPRSVVAGSTTTTAPGTTSAAPKAPPANLEEIRRRMMEKRKQDLK